MRLHRYNSFIIMVMFWRFIDHYYLFVITLLCVDQMLRFGYYKSHIYEFTYRYTFLIIYMVGQAFPSLLVGYISCPKSTWARHFHSIHDISIFINSIEDFICSFNIFLPGIIWVSYFSVLKKWLHRRERMNGSVSI